MKNHFSMAFGNQFSHEKRRTKAKHTSCPIAGFQSEKQKIFEDIVHFLTPLLSDLRRRLSAYLDCWMIVIAAVSMTPLSSSTQTCLTYDESIKALLLYGL